MRYSVLSRVMATMIARCLLFDADGKKDSCWLGDTRLMSPPLARTDCLLCDHPRLDGLASGALETTAVMAVGNFWENLFVVCDMKFVTSHQNEGRTCTTDLSIKSIQSIHQPCDATVQSRDNTLSIIIPTLLLHHGRNFRNNTIIIHRRTP